MMRPIRRVLIVHPYGIGDLIFTTPILRALRLLPGITCVDLMLGSRTKEMIETNPHVDDIFVLDRDLWKTRTKLENLKVMFKLGKLLKRKRYDLLIDFSMRREYAFWSKFVLGIPRRVGFDYKKRATFHNFRYPLADGFNDRHVSSFYSELAETVGVPVESRFLEFYVDEKAKVLAEAFFEKSIKAEKKTVVILAPGGGESWGADAALKRWPVDSFKSFSEKLFQKIRNVKFVIIGSPKERVLAEELQQKLGEKSLNIAGDFSVMETAAIIKKSNLFVGNDGGLMHIAHALRVPTISVFGPTDPKVYGPYPANDGAIVVSAESKPSYERFRYNKEDRSIQTIDPNRVWADFEKSVLFQKYFKENIIL